MMDIYICGWILELICTISIEIATQASGILVRIPGHGNFGTVYTIPFDENRSRG